VNEKGSNVQLKDFVDLMQQVAKLAAQAAGKAKE